MGYLQKRPLLQFTSLEGRLLIGCQRQIQHTLVIGIVVQDYMSRPGTFFRLVSDGTSRIVILFAINGIQGRNY